MIEAFVIFALLVLADIFAAQRWLPLYFRFGIPVSMISRTAGRSAEAGPLDEAAARRLTERFRARPAHPTIEFHPLPGGGLAFRERMFENRGGFKYLPVIHSTARRGGTGQVTVTGFLNLYVLFIIGYLPYRIAGDRTFIAVALLVLVILGLSLAAQVSINRAVADLLAGENDAPSTSRG